MSDKMVDVRYTGTASWSRVVLKDDGTLKGMESVAPGAVVSLPEHVAKHLCGDGTLPSSQCNFVMLPSKEEKKEAVPHHEERRAAPAQADRKN